MDLSLTDFDLGRYVSETYSLHIEDYAGTGRVVKYVSTLGKGKVRDYLKGLKFHCSYSDIKISRYVKLIARITRPKNGYFCVINLKELEGKIKEKYDLVHNYHYCYSKKAYYGVPIFKGNDQPTHKKFTCKCCGDVSLKPNDHKPATCSKECKTIYKVHVLLRKRWDIIKAKQKENKYFSTRYMSQGSNDQLPLITFVNYVSTQKRHKLKSLKAVK